MYLYNIAVKHIRYLVIKKHHYYLALKHSTLLGLHVLCLVIQLCPTLCNPTDCSPPGSSVHGDSPGKDTGVGNLFLLQGIFPTQESSRGLPALQADSLLAELSGKPSLAYAILNFPLLVLEILAVTEGTVGSSWVDFPPIAPWGGARRGLVQSADTGVAY